MKRLSGVALLSLGIVVAAGCGEAPREPLAKAPSLTVRQVIDALGLVPMEDDACPGYSLFTYESSTPADVPQDRFAASLIYYLMTPEAPIDPWHMLTSDEILLYHAGAPMTQMFLYPDGSWEEVVLGPEVDQGQVPQKVIPAGTWMGFVKMDDPQYEWGLYGVMVVPAWHADDVRTARDDADVAELMAQYPDAVARGRELGLF